MCAMVFSNSKRRINFPRRAHHDHLIDAYELSRSRSDAQHVHVLARRRLLIYYSTPPCSLARILGNGRLNQPYRRGQIPRLARSQRPSDLSTRRGPAKPATRDGATVFSTLVHRRGGLPSRDGSYALCPCMGEVQARREEGCGDRVYLGAYSVHCCPLCAVKRSA